MISVAYGLQVLAFLFFAAVLYNRVAPLASKALRERAERVERGLAAAAASERHAREMQEVITHQLAEARGEGERIVEAASRAATAQKETREEQARAGAEGIERRARDLIERERQGAIAQLRLEAGRLALRGATRVVVARSTSDLSWGETMADRSIADIEEEG